MTKETYDIIENYMKECMKDSAHDKEHVYRVFFTAMDIAKHENNVEYDVLIASCLLHDIGRKEQFQNPKLDHAIVGAEKACKFLLINKFSNDFVDKVENCIKSHRFRTGVKPESLEAKILFDADKIDVTGAIGIARTLLYKGYVSEPLYNIDKNGDISDGSNDIEPSFFQEYKYKLEGLYSKFYTRHGKEIAKTRQKAAEGFYNNMLNEVRYSYDTGKEILNELI